jgi:hypothetical protein
MKSDMQRIIIMSNNIVSFIPVDKLNIYLKQRDHRLSLTGKYVTVIAAPSPGCIENLL